MRGDAWHKKKEQQQQPGGCCCGDGRHGDEGQIEGTHRITYVRNGMMCCMTAGMCSQIRICRTNRTGVQRGRWWRSGGAKEAGAHVGDDGDEGVGDGEREALRGARLEALLHQREAVLPTEEADVAQQMQRDLHVLGNADAGSDSGKSLNHLIVSRPAQTTSWGLYLDPLTTVSVSDF